MMPKSESNEAGYEMATADLARPYTVFCAWVHSTLFARL